MADARPIGVMDSGMGGISTLKSLMRELPNEHFVFWGDNKHAPYGTRDEADIRALTWAIAEKLLARDVKALVIACNTATAASVTDLRARLSIPVLGLEPALKPAAQYAGERKVIVLATEATIKLEKYRQLLERYGLNTVSLPCPELVEFVERGETRSEALDKYARELLTPHAEGGIAAVVLGCTHFVWVRDAIERAAPEARIFDGNIGLARHLREQLAEMDLLREEGEGSFELNTTSGEPEKLEIMRSYLCR